MDIFTPVDFTELFDICFKLYRLIMTSAMFIWEWLQSPIEPELAEFLEISYNTTNVEMMFGSLLIAALVMAAVKMFNPL